MNENTQYDKSMLGRAFQKGMLLALIIAFAPVAIIATGLFLSGHHPQDFSAGLRYLLLGLWLVYVFTADRLAKLQVWRSIPLLRSARIGEIITIVLFSALLAALRHHAGDRSFGPILLQWIKDFGLFLALFGSLYAVFRAITRSRRRARARARSKGKTA